MVGVGVLVEEVAGEVEIMVGGFVVGVGVESMVLAGIVPVVIIEERTILMVVIVVDIDSCFS